MTTRERKLQFINQCGPFALEKSVKAAFAQRGARWLTDEQLEDIASDLVSELRSQQRTSRRNREFYARMHG